MVLILQNCHVPDAVMRGLSSTVTITEESRLLSVWLYFVSWESDVQNVVPHMQCCSAPWSHIPGSLFLILFWSFSQSLLLKEGISCITILLYLRLISSVSGIISMPSGNRSFKALVFPSIIPSVIYVSICFRCSLCRSILLYVSCLTHPHDQAISPHSFKLFFRQKG